MAAKCKFCNKNGLSWSKHPTTGKWVLSDGYNKPHRCETDEIKAAACRYCGANDLHWSNIETPHGTKPMLHESYGLPHACEKELEIKAAQKKEKQDAYNVVKTRVATTPDGYCPKCRGSGGGSITPCDNCYGVGHFDERGRKLILYRARVQIWPFIAKERTRGRYNQNRFRDNYDY